VLRAFQNQTIRTVVIKGWPNESVLYLIFLRLNTGSVQLSPQELRQALHPGPFLTFVEEQSRHIEGLRKVLNLTRPDFRMRDAELLLRYLAFQTFLPNYSGNLKKFLDDACAKLNETWANAQGNIRQQLKEMDAAFAITFEIFGEENAFKKWDGTSYESRFNRAVFDIMMFYFSNRMIRLRLSNPTTRLRSKLGLHKAIEAEFRHLCESSQDFRASLETTTKSIEATTIRLQFWGAALSKLIKAKFPIPRLVGNRIEF
jgi:hypothetical protein